MEKLSNARDILQKDDVLLSIDGLNVANDGTIPFRKSTLRLITLSTVVHIVLIESLASVCTGERIFFDYLTSLKFIGNHCKLGILRNGEVNHASSLALPLPLSFKHHLSCSDITLVCIKQQYIFEKTTFRERRSTSSWAP